MGRTHASPVVDVCVVGSGPAGLTAALELSSRGRTVTLVESGGYRPSRRSDELNDGDHIGERYAGLAQTRHRQIGGTTSIWNVEVDRRRGAKYVPLSPSDLRSWPLTWRELEPHYHRAQAICGLGRFEYGASDWSTGRRPPLGLEGTGLTSGIYQFGKARRFSRDLPRRLSSSGSARILPKATVVALIRDEPRRRIRGVRTVQADGSVTEIEARAVILACGAIENARLLLASGFHSAWLGKGFMEHARDFSLVLMPASDLFARASFYDQHTTEDGIWIGGRIAPTCDAVEEFDIPHASMTLVPRRRRGRSWPTRAVNRLARAAGRARRRRYGWSAVNAPESNFDAFKIVLNLEHDPRASNRIELGNRRDRHGMRLPLLHLEWTDREQARLERLRRLLKEWFQRAGLGELHIKPGARPDLSAHHHAGTTRMGSSPEDGVVDPWGRVYGVENLYAAGASVFRTAGFANPTLTIVAMSVRLAQRVDSELGS